MPKSFGLGSLQLACLHNTRSSPRASGYILIRYNEIGSGYETRLGELVPNLKIKGHATNLQSSSCSDLRAQ